MKTGLEIMGKEKYFTIATDKNEKRDIFACNMITESRVDGLIGMYYVPYATGDVYKYNITRFVRLDEFLSGFHNVEGIIDIMDQIVGVFSGVKDFAISPDMLMYSPSMVYLDMNEDINKAVRMIAVPVKRTEYEEGKKLRGLLSQIMRYLSEEDPRVKNVKDYIMQCDMQDVSGIHDILAQFNPTPQIHEIREEKVELKKNRLASILDLKKYKLNVGKRERKPEKVFEGGVHINIPTI